MTFGDNPGRRKRRASRDAFATLVMLAPASAWGATLDRFGADVIGRVGISSDPFLTDEPSSASGFVELNVAPSYRIDDASGAVEAHASLGRTQYFNDYGSTHHYAAGASSNRRLGEDLDFRAAVDFESAILTGPRTVFSRGLSDLDPATGAPAVEPGPGVDPTVPIDFGEDFEPLDPDLGLAGQRQRRIDLKASAGLTFRPTIEESLDFGVRASRARYPGRTRQSNYRSLGGSFGYSRSINPTLSVGLSSSFDRTEYDGGGAETEVFQPQATLRGRLDETWTINAALGASIVRSDGPAGKLRSTGVSASISTCAVQTRLNTCLSVSRGASPTGEGNVTTQTGVELVASYQMSELETLTGSASYSRTGGTIGMTRDNLEFVRVGQSYERRLSERMVTGVNVDVRLLYGTDRAAKDLTGRVFLSVRFGRRT